MELGTSQTSLADYSMSDFEEDAEDPTFDTDADLEKKDDREELEYDASDSDMEHALNNLPSLPPMDTVKETGSTKEDRDSEKRSTLSPTPSDSGRVLLEIDGRFELVSADDIRARDLGELASALSTPDRSEGNVPAELSTGGERGESKSGPSSQDTHAETKKEADNPKAPDVHSGAEAVQPADKDSSSSQSISTPTPEPGLGKTATTEQQLANSAATEESAVATTSAVTSLSQADQNPNTERVTAERVNSTPAKPASPTSPAASATAREQENLGWSAHKSVVLDTTKRPDSSPPKTATTSMFNERSTSPTQKPHPRRGKSAIASRKEEEARERRAKEAEREAEAKAAFDAWLAIKREKEASENRKRAAARKVEKTEEQRKKEREDECKEVFSAWLAGKTQQRIAEKEIEERERLMMEEQAVVVSAERNHQAYRQWLYRKNQAKKAEQQELIRRHRAHVQEARRIHRSLQARYNTVF